MTVYRLELCPTEAGKQYYTAHTFQTNENAGIDLYIAEDVDAHKLFMNETPTLLDLGVAARMIRMNPDGTEEDVHYWLCPRSSIYKTGLVMANSQGVIDRSYRGFLKAPVWVVSIAAFHKAFLTTESIPMKGQRLFQIVAPDMGWIQEVRIVESLPTTVRGAGGFGSTGRT